MDNLLNIHSIAAFREVVEAKANARHSVDVQTYSTLMELMQWLDDEQRKYEEAAEEHNSHIWDMQGLWTCDN